MLIKIVGLAWTPAFGSKSLIRIQETKLVGIHADPDPTTPAAGKFCEVFVWGQSVISA